MCQHNWDGNPTFFDGCSYAGVHVDEDTAATSEDQHIDGGKPQFEFPWWLLLLILVGLAYVIRRFA